MLKSPKYGWSQIQIGPWAQRVSDLDDAPFLLLDAVESVIRLKHPNAVKFDAEGFDYIIVFDVSQTHVITEDPTSGGFSYFTAETGIEALALELTGDIRRDVEAWSLWTDDEGMPDAERLRRRKSLLTACGIVEERAKCLAEFKGVTG